MAWKKALFPEDDYTPNGYIDNPFHTYRLNQSGVIRSRPAMGFGWFFPHLARGYGRRFIYSSHLNIGIEIEGNAFVNFNDFKKHKVDLTSKYHSKNIVSFNFEHRKVEVAVTFLQPIENAIAAIARVRNLSSTARKVRLFAINNYTRNKNTSGLWEDGLTASHDSDMDALSIKSYSEGTLMLTQANMKSSGYALFRNDAEAEKYITENKRADRRHYEYLVSCTGADGTNTIVGVLEYEFALPAKEEKEVVFALARSEIEDGVRTEIETALDSVKTAFSKKIKEDNNFWEQAVCLSCDFEKTWRHGFVYDTETLRMNLRRPVGIYKHTWDAMQIQAPRSVLAEACFDAMLISYSNPDVAKELLLGTFDDAPEPWVPCTREDGSCNMVAWNGFPCGTAPEWGAPLWVVEMIYRRTKDKRWLRKIYPRIVSYMTWWLNNRTDDEGYAHYLCSYESGQDLSPRFGHQLGGGYDITHIRPSDLMAAMCHSFQTLQFFAEEIGKESAANKWRRYAENFEQKTQSLWCSDGWFHDYDRREKEFTAGYDVMHLGPFFYKLAGENQCEAVREKIRMWCLDSRPHWSTFTLMLAESAFNTGMRSPLSSLAYKLVEYIYSSIDAHEQKPAMPLPGIQHEYWPTSRTWGAEGYGWGCFSVFLIVRTMFGFRESGEEGDSFMLCPSMPEELMVPGMEYEITNLKYHRMAFNLKYTIQNKKEFTALIAFTKGAEEIDVKVCDYNTAQVHFQGTPKPNGVKFHADNFSDYLITIS